MSEQQPDGRPGTPTSEPAPNFPPPQVYGPPAPTYGSPPAATPSYAAPADPYAPAPPGAAPSYQQPYAQPYPQPAPYGGYHQPPGWGTPAYGGYPQPTDTSGSTLGLVIVSGSLVIFGLIGVPSLVIGIIALTKSRTDQEDARRLTRVGWLVLGILVTLAVLIIIIAVAVAASTSSSDNGPTIGTLGTTLPPLALRST